MGDKKKIVLGWLAFFFVLFHTVAIFFTAAPDQISPPGLKKAARFYTESFFDQKWSMFAPCPLLNGHIEANYYHDGNETGWIRPLEDEIKMHSYLRGSHHAELALAESNLLHWVDVDVQSLDLPFDSEWSDENYEEFNSGYSKYKMRMYLNGASLIMYDKPADSAQVRCHFNNVKTGDEGILIMPLYKWNN